MTTTSTSVRLLPCGDTAMSVEFGSAIDPELNARVLALDAALAAEPPAGLRETVPTYRSLLLHFDPLATDLPALKRQVLTLCDRPPTARASARRWRVPVVYGGEFGIDLDDLAARHGMSAEALVARHAAATYVVAMIGFMPGFAYLSGLDPALATPRRTQPRAKTPAQSISIGGAQAAISTVEGPSGWHLIGRTPARGFMPGRDPVFTYAPGDEIRFERIGAEAWAGLDRRAAAGEPIAISEAP
ncbi:MAG: allophanate hydrolase [Chelatococcus sp.]|nr:MAG: allophanate hydrolase [Chelatococcus sp.]